MLEWIDSIFNWMPVQASTFAARVDFINNFITYVSVFCTIAITGMMIYFAIRYSRKRGPATNFMTHNAALETLWTAIPTVVCIYVFWYGFDAYREMREVPANPIEVSVDGFQWAWQFTYENGKRDSNLYVPLGQPVRLVMKSRDVNHSLFIPAMRVKEDLIASQYNYLWFQPIKLGEFNIFCAEYCGDSHSLMLSKLFVVTPEEFDDYLFDRTGIELTPAELGARAYEIQGCKGCHSIDGSALVGPSFKGLWGRKQIMSDGTEVLVDENYVRESILEPQAKIVKGYENAYMQSYQGLISEEEISNLIAWFKTLD